MVINCLCLAENSYEPHIHTCRGATERNLKIMYILKVGKETIKSLRTGTLFAFSLHKLKLCHIPILSVDILGWV